MIDILRGLTRFEKDEQLSKRILFLIGEWARAYDCEEAAIVRQLSIAHSWCVSNPKRAPKSDCVRFLHNWMGKAKEMGSLVTKPVSRKYVEAPVVEDLTYEEMVEIRKRNMPARKPPASVEEPQMIRCELHGRLDCFDCGIAESRKKLEQLRII